MRVAIPPRPQYAFMAWCFTFKVKVYMCMWGGGILLASTCGCKHFNQYISIISLVAYDAVIIGRNDAGVVMDVDVDVDFLFCLVSTCRFYDET
jgi:hypothetical protein